MKGKKVLVAMSGGVDSSAAALLLCEKGYSVEGATMELFGGAELSAASIDSKNVCDTLKIKHHVFDLRNEFEACVIKPFIDEYLNGRTPNPCIRCNKMLKFGSFFEKAEQMGFDYIATGHYASLVHTSQGISLKRTFEKKDQTYVLYNLNQRILSRLLLPVGGMDKQTVREAAHNLGSAISSKPDSQEICFIPDNDYHAFIAKRGYCCEAGEFVDTDGRVIGTHAGLLRYTVGQRKGLGLTFGKPMFVVKLLPDTNRVVLGEDSQTYENQLYADKINWIFGQAVADGATLDVKIRYNGPASQARIYNCSENRVRVEFIKPVRAVTPGQSAVFYQGDILVGGGIIE